MEGVRSGSGVDRYLWWMVDRSELSWGIPCCRSTAWWTRLWRLDQGSTSLCLQKEGNKAERKEEWREEGRKEGREEGRGREGQLRVGDRHKKRIRRRAALERWRLVACEVKCTEKATATITESKKLTTGPSNVMRIKMLPSPNSGENKNLFLCLPPSLQSTRSYLLRPWMMVCRHLGGQGWWFQHC